MKPGIRGLLFFFVFLFSCRQEVHFPVQLTHTDGRPVSLDPDGNKAVVFIFLSPDCPLSQYYTLPLAQLYSEFSGRVLFAGIFPGKDYSYEEIKNFMAAYSLPFEGYLDIEKRLTGRLKATVTPEAFVIDSLNRVIYSGAIDNAAVDLTIKRRVVTKQYLKDALKQYLSGKKIETVRTRPVGCFIEKQK